MELKAPLSFDEQVKRLIAHKMDIVDVDSAKLILSNINYQTWRKAPVFRYGDISHTLFSRKHQTTKNEGYLIKSSLCYCCDIQSSMLK